MTARAIYLMEGVYPQIPLMEDMYPQTPLMEGVYPPTHTHTSDGLITVWHIPATTSSSTACWRLRMCGDD